MTRSICNSCGGVWDGSNPMDMYDCENHCPFNCRQCGKDYLMPDGGYNTNYCSQECFKNHVDEAKPDVCERCNHPKAAHMKGNLKCWIGKQCPCTGFMAAEQAGI